MPAIRARRGHLSSRLIPCITKRRLARRWSAAQEVVVIFQDVCVGIRVLRRNSGFSLVAVLCLMLGISSTTSVFSWIEGILMRPFPMVARQERMFAMTGTDRNGRTDISWPDFQDLQRNCRLVILRFSPGRSW